MGDFKTTTTGGDKLKRILRKIETTRGVTYDARVGFFSKDRYADGTPVAEVAKNNNFGIGVPQRPFFSQALARFKKKRKDIYKELFTKKLSRKEQLESVEKIATILVNNVKSQITTGEFKPNSPATIRIKTKRGLKNRPLVATGLMLRSVRKQVEDKKK